MILRLFRSAISSPRLPRLSSLAGYSGLELSLPQLEDASAPLEECARRSLRVICRLGPVADACDAEAQLHRLSSTLRRHTADAAAAVELVLLQAPAANQDATHDYLRAIQPVWSEFLEEHTSVGSRP